jgi:3',5'-cyclic AMP phosphodiesterase CpdA
MGTILAQLSDMHVVREPSIDGGPTGGAENLAVAVDAIQRMSTPPDAVVLTGDLTDHGTVEEYELLRSVLAPLTMPVMVIPGNHDVPQHLWEVLGWPRGAAEVGGRVHHVREVGDVRVVGLDSSRPDRTDGEVTEDDAAWLDRVLAGSSAPTAVLVHHPPFRTGIWWMDAIGLTGAGLLEQVVRRHPHVGRVLSGHVHRLISTQWGPTGLYVAPSQVRQTMLDLEPFHAPTVTAEAPQVVLHVWTGTGWVTHTRDCLLPDRVNLREAVPGWHEFEDRLRDAFDRGAPL